MSSPRIIVIGAGHAGIEAATAAARMGAQVTLITLQMEAIAQMSCNPSIGGIAKGHLVREIDILGGWMARAADRTAIHFKVLNRSKGPAVRAARTQNDKDQYRTVMRHILDRTPNLSLYQSMVQGLRVCSNRVTGVRLQDGAHLDADAVIVTTGTFLNGRIVIGDSSYSAGRANEPASCELAEDLKNLGFSMIRLKTGTPMRLHADSIDFSLFTPQPGDEPALPFSIHTRRPLRNRALCYAGRTTPELKKLIQDHIHLNPLYSGQIKGIGPRYCPSLEDKIMRFPDKETHHFFLEPEGLSSREIYVNGFSTSFPVALQQRILQTVPGLNRAQIIRPAYAVEYDAIRTSQIAANLSSRALPNLFFAGQINGTSGYEEAAGQGVYAGINAVLYLQGDPPFILDRHQAYIGVMVDDLIHRGIDEPYRLFTSRAEHRLQLREDNVYDRLGEFARHYRLLSPKTLKELEKQYAKRQTVLATLSKTMGRANGESRPLTKWLKRPEIDWQSLCDRYAFDPGISLTSTDIAYIEATVKYSGYIEIQNREVDRSRQRLTALLPPDLPFHLIPGLSTEVRQKLSRNRPATLGEAARLPGITPAALNALSIYLTLHKKKGKRPPDSNNIKNSEETHHDF